MVNSILAAAALFGAAVAAGSVGRAHVVNKCNYDVYLCNVPASGGGYEQVDQTLSPGDSYSQAWTQLSNMDGWSIKLSQDDNVWGSRIMQYEYTFHNDGVIWYDLSCVDGNPWDEDWEITASGSCTPKQQAYRYSTDDAYGMQSCDSDAEITVTLCTGKSVDNGTSVDNGSGSGSSEPSSGVSAPSYETPTPTVLSSYPETTPTTFMTSTTAVGVDWNGEIVTQVETVFVTAVETQYAEVDGGSLDKVKRHQHHQHGHAHHM